MRMSQRRLIAPLAVLGVAGLALAGCSGGPGGGGGDNNGGSGGADDNVVTVYGTIADTEAELLEKSWAAWEEENGIDIKYESSKARSRSVRREATRPTSRSSRSPVSWPTWPRAAS